ncbi:MAG: lipocalin family protein [Planctomycetes bacterium]|nr:lipocalin family protein [Planctomycetota bacterium]
MHTRFAPLLALALLAGCGKDDSSSSSSSSSSSARHIEGGTAGTFRGVAYDVPKTWQIQPRGDAVILFPEGSNPTGQVEELYMLVADTAVKDLAGADFERSIEKGVGQIQPGATKASGPDSKRFGDLDGRAWVYSCKTPDGRSAEVRAFGFMGTCGCALLAIGFPDVLAKRDPDVQAILGSLSKPPAPPPGTASVRPELAGTWIWITNFNANSGGRQTDTTLVLGADGSYRYSYNSVNSNPFGAAWGSERDAGTWTATENSITFKSQDGRAVTQTLEKRNHPKNTGDPMIILDGKAFVTALRKDPW